VDECSSVGFTSQIMASSVNLGLTQRFSLSGPSNQRELQGQPILAPIFNKLPAGSPCDKVASSVGLCFSFARMGPLIKLPQGSG
jgi:hypothetical protein